MSPRSEIRPRAEADIADRHEWLRRHRSEEVATAWFHALQEAIVAAAERPLLYPVSPEAAAHDSVVRNALSGPGRQPSHRIPYRMEDDGIVVLAVRHLNQRPLTPRELR